MSNFSTYAHQYLDALPDMQRSWVLPNQKGILWCPSQSNDEGVLFSFSASSLPEGVEAHEILSKGSSSKFSPKNTYRLSGRNLPVAFGMSAPTHDDNRLLKTVSSPKNNWSISKK